jgi:hypothetical protein
MRSTTIRLATAVGVALAVCAAPQASFAQAGSDFQDQGVHEDLGAGALPSGHGPYAQVNQRAPSYNGSLSGYSARPAGMCWERLGGGGQDISSGYWAKCKAH